MVCILKQLLILQQNSFSLNVVTYCHSLKLNFHYCVTSFDNKLITTIYYYDLRMGVKY